MKRSRHNFDSMELLLDAMCNVFGAVLFAALLVGGVSIVRQAPAAADRVPWEQLRQLQLENSLLDAQLQASTLECSILQNLPQKKTPAGQSTQQQALRRKYQQQVQQANTLAGAVEAAADRLQQKKQQRAWLKKFSAQSQQTVARLERSIDLLQKKLASPPKKSITILSAGETDKLRPYRLIVTANKVYPAGSDNDIFGKTLPDSVKATAFRQGDQEFYLLQPIPGKGINIADLKLDMLKLPADFANKYFIEMAVEPDAIAAAAEILKVIRQGKLLHAWHTVKPGEAFWRTAARSSYEVAK